MGSLESLGSLEKGYWKNVCCFRLIHKMNYYHVDFRRVTFQINRLVTNRPYLISSIFFEHTWCGYILKVTVKVVHISTAKISQTINDMADVVAIAIKHEILDWNIYIWTWPFLEIMVKAMHISTANLSKIWWLTDKANTTIANKYEVAYIYIYIRFRLAYIDLTSGHSKGQPGSWNVASSDMLVVLFGNRKKICVWSIQILFH